MIIQGYTIVQNFLLVNHINIQVILGTQLDGCIP